MEQSLSMSLRQKLAMTAQMQQAIRILQLSAHDLQALVETEYLENPALEMEDPAQSREAEPEDGRLSLEQVSELARFLGDEERGPHDFHENTGRSFEAGSAVRPSLETELREQAAFVFPPGRQRRIAFFLIGSVDDCGYLQCTLADAARQLRVPEAEAEEVLTVLQGFERSLAPGLLVLELEPQDFRNANACLRGWSNCPPRARCCPRRRSG